MYTSSRWKFPSAWFEARWAVLAIVFARIAKKKILYDDFLGGDGLATAGQTLGIIGLLLVAIAVFILLMEARLKAFVDDFFNWDTIKVKHYIEGHPNNLTHQIAKPAQSLIPNFPSNAAYYDVLVQVEPGA